MATLNIEAGGNSYTLAGGTLDVTGSVNSAGGPLIVNGGYWSASHGPISAPLVPASDPAVNLSYSLGSFPQLGAVTYVGQNGAASLAQSGGSQMAGVAYFGYNPGATGNYTLSGGSLAVTSSAFLGYSGTGTFTQSGGSNTVASNLYLGYNPGGNGTYTLSGGWLSIPGLLCVGNSGTGNFAQTAPWAP